jgi:hypothetical protein
MAERYIPEHRRTQFKAKNTFKPDELRRRREEQQVEIRKAKREENLAKRRGIGTGENRPGASLGAAPDSEDENPPTESQVCRQQLLALYFFLSLLVRFWPSASSHSNIQGCQLVTAVVPRAPRALQHRHLVPSAPHLTRTCLCERHGRAPPATPPTSLGPLPMPASTGHPQNKIDFRLPVLPPCQLPCSFSTVTSMLTRNS